MILGRIRCRDRCKNLSYFIRKSLGYLNPSHLSLNGDSRTVRDVAIKNSTAIKCVNSELIRGDHLPATLARSNVPATRRPARSPNGPNFAALRWSSSDTRGGAAKAVTMLRLQTSVKISYQTERRYLCNSYNLQWTVKEELLFQESSEKNSRWKMEVT